MQFNLRNLSVGLLLCISMLAFKVSCRSMCPYKEYLRWGPADVWAHTKHPVLHQYNSHVITNISLATIATVFCHGIIVICIVINCCRGIWMSCWSQMLTQCKYAMCVCSSFALIFPCPVPYNMGYTLMYLSARRPVLHLLLFLAFLSLGDTSSSHLIKSSCIIMIIYSLSATTKPSPLFKAHRARAIPCIQDFKQRLLCCLQEVCMYTCKHKAWVFPFTLSYNAFSSLSLS